jgi:serine protease Do
LSSYRDIVKRVLPTVVSIQAKLKAGKKGQLPPDVPEEFRKRLEQQQDDGVIGFGSGCVIDPAGLVLTNHHVVEGADIVEVTLTDGRKFTAKEVKSDAKTDVAIVKLDTTAVLSSLDLGDSDAMEVGDRVLAVGAPFGLTGSVTCGIISAKGRSLRMNVYEDFLQTDAAINPGNSGGPLVNLEGKMIGITSAIKSRSGGFQGVGLAISSNLVRGIMDQLQKEGTVRRGYLGAEIKDVTDQETAVRVGVPPNGGVLVTRVMEGTPGAKGGLKVGDVVVAVNGKAVRDGRELQQLVGVQPLGKAAQISVVRDRQVRTLSVTIEEQPAEFGTKSTTSRSIPPPQLPVVPSTDLGLETADLTPTLAEKLGFPPKTVGALIVEVKANSAAAKAGLKSGGLITKVDRQVIRSNADLKSALDRTALAAGVLVQVRTAEGDVSYALLKTD